MNIKLIRADLPANLKTLELHPFADFHLGDPHCDFKHIIEMINHVRDTENAYCILNGDLMDSAVRQSIGDIYSANLQPMEQLQQCVKIFDPIKSKILAVTGNGNHEARIYKNDGIDMTRLMCAQLGIENKYTETTAVLFIRFGENWRKKKMFYSAYITHGSGGGRKEGGKVNRIADLASIVDVDLYIHSHTHLPLTFKETFFRIDSKNNAVTPVTKLFVNTSAQLNYGGYGDIQGYKPASTDNPVIFLDGTKHKMNCIV